MSCLCPSAPRSHHFECRNARNPFRTATRPPSARTELATELHRLQAGGVQQLADRAAVEELAALRAELAAADATGDAWAPTGAADGLYARSWALDDVQILRTTDGRTVAAYAAVFDTPAEIRDKHGHYVEVIDRAAFNRQLADGVGHVSVLYNHGLTMHNTPSELGAVPIGSPVSIRADRKGLRTVTRFNNSELANAVLEAIRAGDLKGYSFRGQIFRSNPDKLPRTRPGTDLPTVTRLEMGLIEYGPTPMPAYETAQVLAAGA